MKKEKYYIIYGKGVITESEKQFERKKYAIKYLFNEADIEYNSEEHKEKVFGRLIKKIALDNKEEILLTKYFLSL